jgi:phospholipid-binding lipoprotein MlaA
MFWRPFILTLLLFMVGCTSWRPDPALKLLPEPSHPKDAQLLLQPAPDPLEPINRAFFAVDKTLFTYALEPVWTGYNAVVPLKARNGIRRFSDNLKYPVRLTGNLLQGEWANAGTETKRFLINTTVGVLGFSDPATDKYKIYLAEEDLGQAFGKWGWTDSAYIHIPVWGASSPRDVAGGIGAISLNPSSWFYGAGVAFKFNSKSYLTESTRQLLDTEFDPYALNKLYYTRKRAIEIANTQPTMAGENTPQTQTLLAVFNRPQDGKFHQKAGKINVQPIGFRKPLPASIWMQDKPAPIAFVIPGLGGHRLSTQALALAELAYLEGYHVVCFSNNLNWEFIQSAPSDYLPGYLGDDLKYLRQIHEATIVKVGDKANGKPAVMGFSMGGWYTLNLAASGAPDAYSNALAINPPLNLNTGLRMLDKLFRAPAGKKDLEVIKESALVKLLVSQHRTPEQGALPFSDQEASFLIGLSYRLTLTQTIMTSLDIAPSSEAHKKIGALGWEDYYSKLVTPALAKRKINADALNRASNLRTREAGLTASKNLKLVLTGNDFLLTQEDLAWLRQRFPDKRTIFTETGGHMGQLWKPEVREAMRAAIRLNPTDSSSK